VTARHWQNQRRRGTGRGLGRKHIDDFDGRDKPIPLAGDCLDESPRLAQVAQCLPDLANRSVDTSIKVGEDVWGPQAFHHFVARHELLAAFEQQQQQIHRLTGQRNPRAAPPHLVSRYVNLEFAEPVGHAG
jgi:hypothetical protein